MNSATKISNFGDGGDVVVVDGVDGDDAGYDETKNTMVIMVCLMMPTMWCLTAYMRVGEPNGDDIRRSARSDHTVSQSPYQPEECSWR